MLPKHNGAKCNTKGAKKPAAAKAVASIDGAAALATLSISDGAPSGLFTADSMTRVFAFLLGTHPRVGAESIVRKLSPDSVRKILMDVREPRAPAPSIYHFQAKLSRIGTIDFWAVVGPAGGMAPQIVVQHSCGDSSRARGPSVTRFLGRYDGFTKFCVQINFTHKATGVDPRCPLDATAEQCVLRRSKLGQPSQVPRLSCHWRLLCCLGFVAALSKSPRSTPVTQALR